MKIFIKILGLCCLLYYFYIVLVMQLKRKLRTMPNFNEHPQLMGRIINIQIMSKALIPGYDQDKDFTRLSAMTDEQLWNEQEEMVKQYNNRPR